MDVCRPALRWHGGKWLLAPWIISHFPRHKIYVEPFGGAMSVLLRKHRSYAEIYNDLDQSVVNLFRVLRSDRAHDLHSQILATPFSRVEFLESYVDCSDEVESARRLVIRSFMGFGSNSHERVSGFRANSNRSGSTPAHDWKNYGECMGALIARVRGVVIENKDAKAVMLQHDGPASLHYVDPPYVLSTRSDFKKDYAVELSDADHLELLSFLKTLAGSVILSGYKNEIYEQNLLGWKRFERESFADGARKRTEVLWLNQAAVSRSAGFGDFALIPNPTDRSA